MRNPLLGLFLVGCTAAAPMPTAPAGPAKGLDVEAVHGLGFFSEERARAQVLLARAPAPAARGCGRWPTFTQNAIGLSGDYRSDLAGLVLRARTYFVLWRGLWVSPLLQGGVGKVTENGTDVLGGVGAAGASVGYAFMLVEHLLLSAGLGVQLHGAWIGGRSPPSFFGAWPHVDLIAGYIW